MVNISKNTSETINLNMLGKDLRIEVACALYKDEKISFGKAVEIAGTSYEDMKKILYERGIKRKTGSERVEELLKNVKDIERWKKEQL